MIDQAMPPAERLAKVDEYTRREAWAYVLGKIREATAELFEGGEEEDLVLAMETDVTSPLLNELWPDDHQREELGWDGAPDYETATTRAMTLEAAILMQLTTADAQEWLRSEAARITKLVADRQARSKAASHAS